MTHSRIFFLVCLFGMMSIDVSAAVESYYELGLLTIYGNGAMDDYDETTHPKWYSVKEDIKTVVIGSGVTSIGNAAFKGCTKLSNISLPSTITSIGKEAFQNCTALTSISIPNSVTSIGGSAFWGCEGLTSIEIPNSVTRIGEMAFAYCGNLSSVTMGNGVETIETAAFQSCIALTSFSIPNSVTSLGQTVFELCENLQSVVIGSSVTDLKFRVFGGCTSLTSVSIPKSVSTISKSAFSGCTSLNDVTVSWNEPLTISAEISFGSVIQNMTLKVPFGSLSKYQEASVWGGFGTIVEGTLLLSDSESTLTPGTYAAGHLGYRRTNGSLMPGNYGTFCVPFDIDLDDPAIGEQFQKVCVPMNVAFYKDGNVYLFGEKLSGVIKAGTPFMALLSSSVNGSVMLYNCSNTRLSGTETGSVVDMKVFNFDSIGEGIMEENESVQISWGGTFSDYTSSGLYTFKRNGNYGTDTMVPAFRSYVMKSVTSNVKEIFFSMDGGSDAETAIKKLMSESSTPSDGSDIYSIDGKRRGRDLQQLPRGLYIVNGRKVLK